MLEVLFVPEVPVMRCVLSLCAGGCGGWALFAARAGGAGRDAVCATPYARGAGDAGGDALCALCMLEAAESGLRLLEVLEAQEVLEVSKVIRCVLSVEGAEEGALLLQFCHMPRRMRRKQAYRTANTSLQTSPNTCL